MSSCCNSNPFAFNPSPIAMDSISGLFQELFGDGSGLVYTNGKWTFTPVLGFPKLANEGIIDYMVRILGSGEVLFNKGYWQAGITYCKGSLVGYNNKYWTAQTETTSNPAVSTDWKELLYSLEGLQGQAGEDGSGTIIIT